MATLKLVIGNKNYSSWSLRPWFFLKQHGIAFVEERIPLDTPEFKPAVDKYKAGGKVPILVDDGICVWDSLAILEYVSDNFVASQGWPRDRKARALARSMSAEMHSGFSSLRGELPMNCRKVFKGLKFSQATQNDIARITDLWCQCRKEFAEQGPWLFGDFSIADAMFAPVVLRFIGYEVSVDEQSQAYMHNVLTCDAIQSWVNDAKAETEIVEQDER